ncbi:MAG: hypothetical protein JJ896_07695 [Rhodothermales bacterium]|nr:hypothetical protein [Rhodothermales bacterium]MBO6779522.1 hypothetical protein [Rhodothermales bacterium]
MRRVAQILRWVLAAVVAFYLVVFAGDLLAFETEVPALRAAAVEAAGFDGDPDVQYAATRDSLGVRLAERAAAGTTDARRLELEGEIADWQQRMGTVMRHVDVQRVASRYRLYGWTAVTVLAALLLVLMAGPAVKRRLNST